MLQLKQLKTSWSFELKRQYRVISNCAIIEPIDRVMINSSDQILKDFSYWYLYGSWSLQCDHHQWWQAFTISSSFDLFGVIVSTVKFLIIKRRQLYLLFLILILKKVKEIWSPYGHLLSWLHAYKWSLAFDFYWQLTKLWKKNYLYLNSLFAILDCNLLWTIISLPKPSTLVMKT